jgi:hypothetical protein
MLFIICGRDIQYSQITPGRKNDDKSGEIKNCGFKAPAFELEDDAEVCEVLSTEEKNHYQFVIRDEDKRIVVICTWDIESECEVSMVQFPIEGNDRPGKHVVKGLN